MNSMLDEKENYEISGEKRRITLFNISSCENGSLTRIGIWRNTEKCSTFAPVIKNIINH